MSSYVVIAIAVVVFLLVALGWWDTRRRQVFYLDDSGKIATCTWGELGRKDASIFMVLIDESVDHRIETYQVGVRSANRVQWLGWQVFGYAGVDQLCIEDSLGVLGRNYRPIDVLKKARLKASPVIGAR
ncbi:MAG: hypothetical protein ABSE91_04220 [Patescibacteria group bacterium]|jgi:hypothetical protein